MQNASCAAPAQCIEFCVVLLSEVVKRPVWPVKHKIFKWVVGSSCAMSLCRWGYLSVKRVFAVRGFLTPATSGDTPGFRYNYSPSSFLSKGITN